jgi:hypothetical protein
MLSDAERNVLNSALEKYRPGQSEPILVGGENLLQPALQLMSLYRLRIIEEIKESEAITSYTRWLEAVQVKGADNREVLLNIQSALRAHLAGVKEAPSGIYGTGQPILDFEANILCVFTVGQKSMSRREPKAFRLKSCEKFLAWSRSKMRPEMSFKKRPCWSGRIFGKEHWVSQSRRSIRRRIEN